MTRQRLAAAAIVLLGLASLAAGPPVAMRVELEAVGSVAGGTTMAITIQVAPEDRARLGSDVWVQGELLRRGERADRLARALDVDQQGEAHFEVIWPPGSYELRLEVRGAQRDVNGVWIGPVTIPSTAAVGEVVAPEPAGADDAARGGAGAASSGAAATAAAARPSQPSPVPPSTAADQPLPERAGQPSRTPAAEREPTAAKPSSQPAPAAAAAPVVVEPPAAQASPRATATAWTGVSDGNRDLTVVVTERNRPILGLGPTAFDLQVGGSSVPVDVVGDAASAPLNLGLVVDLSGDLEAADAIVRRLGGLALRARNGGNLFVLSAANPNPVWGASADDIARAIADDDGSAPSLALMVRTALGAFSEVRGRSFLLVVTNGRDDSARSEWKETVAAAERAGVPVLVVGARDADFSSRARSSLIRIAETTGGRSYFLGDPGVVGMTLDYLGELIDASYALPYPAAGAGAGAREVKVQVTQRDWEVAHPRRVP